MLRAPPPSAWEMVPKLDKNEYAHMTLPNGLKVYMIYDKDATKAGFSMVEPQPVESYAWEEQRR